MAAVDKSQGGFGEPASHAFAVTPDDNSDVQAVTRALFIGSVAGGTTLTVVMQGGEQVTFSGLAAGTLIPLRVSRVLSTGTLVSSIMGLY